MEYLTSTDVAGLLGVSDMTIRRMAHAGEIPFVRLSDNRWHRFERGALEQWAVERNVTLNWSALEKTTA